MANIEEAAKCPSGYKTQTEAAKYLGKSLRTIERWRVLRMGPPHTQLGKQPVYRTSSIDDWLHGQEIKPIRRTKHAG
jgi:hypothetical protein